MTSEEKKIFDGVLYCPADPELKAIKLRAHNLNTEYNRLFEDEKEERDRIIHALMPDIQEGFFFQGPIYLHYGTHTHIGKRFFGNFNLTIQDDTHVYIGDDCNFGPNVTIVTPCHPMIASERNCLYDASGQPKRFCYAKPVRIGSNCWFGANVVVCPGVTIGDDCVIGAGSVVTRDIPAGSFAAGDPCRVIRPITEADSMAHKPEILADNSVSAK